MQLVRDVDKLDIMTLIGESVRSGAFAREGVNEERTALIEAWYEWGEGSVLETTAEHGFGWRAARTGYLLECRRHRTTAAMMAANTTPQNTAAPSLICSLAIPPSALADWLDGP